ncbi:MAG TPA: hypothetical protein VIA06_02550 [Candidatus Dormibacteraeota bacterium]|nr:hypothetical protein [Candidatus Dormibacteraeota bacterium]
MALDTDLTTGPSATSPQEERIRAHYGMVRKLGNWTSALRFDVRATRGNVLLDLRSPRIEEGDIEIRLDIDHALLRLLVPEDATVEHEEVRRVGAGRVKDGGVTSSGRRIHLHGEMRNAEVRVQRGGVAMLSAMLTREYVQDLRQAHREGRYPTIDDPTRGA